jgi:hypothetical protein
MLAQLWEVVKATLAVSALIAAALVSADKLDRQRIQASPAAALSEPAMTGAIAPVARP